MYERSIYMEKSYHHGNLKEELIKKGIELINEVGEEKLSLTSSNGQKITVNLKNLLEIKITGM